MEFLKRYVLFVVFIVLTSVNAAAQGGDVTAVFAKSYELENDGKYGEAVLVLKKVSADTYALNLRLGWLSYLDGKYKEAMNYYAKAIQLRPSSIEARLGFVLPAAKLKEWTKVGEQYDAVLRLDPNNYKANYYRGLMFFNVGNYKTAGTYFNRIEHLYPFDYDIVILTAWNFYYLKEKGRAKALFNQALLIQPTSASAAEGLALCR